MNYGYARVSTSSQKLDRQLDELANYQIDKIFQEKESGKSFDRQQFRSLIRTLKKNDTLYICSIDRLGRNYDELLDNWRLITQKKEADIIVLDMPILNTKGNVEGLDGKFISNLVLQILSYVAQKEREKIKERQAQGIESAKKRGVKFGRPQVPIPDGFEEIAKQYKNKEITSEEALRLCGLARGTFFRKLALLQL